MFQLSPTLLDSFLYYRSIEDEVRSAEKRQEVIDYLNGIKGEPSEPMLKGIRFESDVVLAMAGQFKPTDDEKYNACIQEVFEIVNGSLCQQHLQSKIGNVIVHGYADFLKLNRIIDTKYCGEYNIGKYQKKTQHLIYLYCTKETNIDRFSYVATDFKNVYREDYTWNSAFEDELRARIAEFFDYLESDNEMKQAFIGKFKAA